jgi:GWxTD domain-containing protein
VDLRSNINKILLLIFLSAAFSGLHPQTDKPAASSGEIQFYLDKASFLGDGKDTYVELYFMFYADGFSYDKNNKGEAGIQLVIEDMDAKVMTKKDWTIDVSLNSIEDTTLRTKVFYDQVNEYLSPGEYNFRVTARDLNSRRSGELNAIYEVPGFNENEFRGSEIEFINSVNESVSSGQFRKGNTEIIPNPSRRYGLLNPSLRFYYELYGIPQQDTLMIRYSVKKDQNVVDEKVLERSAPAGKISIIHGLDVSGLSSGNYELAININSASGKALKMNRNFEIIQNDLSSSPGFTEDDDKMYKAILSYIAPGELSSYNSLDLEGKSRFIVEFWKRKDPSPGTIDNEYMREIQQRFAYADKNFSWANVKGWATDMGKILIKYGFPDEVQQHHSEADILPYQVWLYSRRQGYQFVFGDLHANGRFILLHSNHEEEVSNINWKELLKKM